MTPPMDAIVYAQLGEKESAIALLEKPKFLTSPSQRTVLTRARNWSVCLTYG